MITQLPTKELRKLKWMIFSRIAFFCIAPAILVIAFIFNLGLVITLACLLPELAMAFLFVLITREPIKKAKEKLGLEN